MLLLVAHLVISNYSISLRNKILVKEGGWPLCSLGSPVIPPLNARCGSKACKSLPPSSYPPNPEIWPLLTPLLFAYSVGKQSARTLAPFARIAGSWACTLPTNCPALAVSRLLFSNFLSRALKPKCPKVLAILVRHVWIIAGWQKPRSLRSAKG